MIRSFFVILIFITGCGGAFAQDVSPAFLIHGAVVDQNRAVVTGATVTAIPANGLPTLKTASDANGEFSLSLFPGKYTLTIAAEGFDSLTKSITVSPGKMERIEINLEVAAKTATVTVTSSGEYQTSMISSATRTQTPLIDVPQTVSVIGRQQIADQLFASIGDVVRYQPGITAHQGENNRDQIVIRGQSSSADFFVNGVRDDVQYYRDLYNLERVEALRGPNALAFGRGGGGGVINRVTKQAGFSPGYEFTLQGGSYGNRRAAFDLNRPITSKLAVRANGIGEYSESFRRGVDLRRFGFSPSITFDPNEKTTLKLSYEFFRDRRTADRGITSFQGQPSDVPISTYYGNPDDSRVQANVDVISGSFERQIGKLNIQNRITYGNYDRFYQNYVAGTVNDAKTLVNLTAYNNSTRRRNLFNQTDMVYKLSTGGIKHTLLGGFELGRQHSNNFRNTGFFNNSTTSIQVAYDDPLTRIPVIFRQSATDADNRVHVNLASGYLQDQMRISRYFQLIGGVRFDYFDLNFHNNRNNTNLRRIDRLISPRVGAVVKPISGLSLYGSFSVSYLPSSGDQFSSLTSITQQVKPEKFTNLEAGIKWDIRSNLSFTSAIYQLDRTDTRSTDPNDPTRIVQTGSQRTNGFEVGLNGNITRNWTLTGGYAYQDAFISSATASATLGKQVAQVPHHSFSFWNKYQVSRKLAAGLGIIRRTDMFAGVDNTVTLPGYTRADAAVYYAFSERWRIQANVENLLNTRYFLNADSNTNITPGSPRSARVAFVARF